MGYVKGSVGSPSHYSARVMDMARQEDGCRRKFRKFVKYAWPVIDSQPLAWGWHADAICDHLQAVSEGHIQKLIISIPPGHAKSLFACTLWPAWEWINHPETRSLFGSYDKELARRDSSRCRDVFLSDWYQEIFQPTWEMKRDSNAKGFYTNTANGNRYTFGLRSGGRTGWRGDKVVIDDPISIDDQWNARIKADCYLRFNNTLSTRVNDPRTAQFVVIGQRVAHDDLCGMLIKDEHGYEVLKLPALFEPAKRCRTSIGWEDPRQEKGELLFPELFPLPVIEYYRDKKLGEVGFATQFQQEPTSEQGTLFKRAYFRWWEDRGGTYLLHHKNGTDEPILAGNCWTFVSVDVAASEETYADFTVFGIWMVTPKYDMILLDIQMGQWTQPEAQERAVRIYKESGFGKRKQHVAFVVEANGVGLPLIQNMHRLGLPTVGVNIHRDKVAMSATAVLRMEVGSIFLPFYETKELRLKYPFMEGFIEELTNFPGIAKDDQVTMISLAAEGVFQTGIVGLGGAATLESLERPTAAQTIQFTPNAPRRTGMYGTGGRA